MARTLLRLVRATATQVAAYTGPAGEPVVNTDTGGIHLQDGSTPGGTPLMRAGHTPGIDTDYQIKVSDAHVGFVTLITPRTAPRPDADSYPLGQVLFIADGSGQCSTTRPITIAVGVGSGDSIAGASAIQLSDAYLDIGFRRGAANVWIIAR